MRIRPRHGRTAIPLALCVALVALLAVSFGGPAGAAAGKAPAGASGFASAGSTGFHDLALLYPNQQRTAASLTNWVADYQNGTPVRGGWMFDSFLLLDDTAPSGTMTASGATTSADWNALLDQWFGAAPGGGVLGQLNSAISTVATSPANDRRVMGPPPTRRTVVIELPWADPAETSFGTVNGQAANLSLPAQRDRVTASYLQQVKARFAAAGYTNLSLWGVYLMREDITSPDTTWVTHATAAAHSEGLKVAWIPYYGAPGWQQWRTFGIDVAILQPGYAFDSPSDGGTASASRITAAATEAAANGLGVEVEARGSGGSAYESALLAQYLAEGIRLGFRAGASAFFLGADVLPTAQASSYQMLASYLTGGAVSSPDLVPDWSWTSSGTTSTATSNFSARGDLTAARVDLAAASAGWRGTVQVSEQVGGAWGVAGTALAGAPSTLDGTAQSVLVPLAYHAGVTGLRASFVPSAGAGAVSVSRISADTIWPTGDADIATGASYTVSAASAPAPIYADTSSVTTTGLGRGKLTDGQWSTASWSPAASIGWQSPQPVRILIDLGQVRPISNVVLYTHGGSSAAVNWPVQAAAYITGQCGPAVINQRGPSTGCSATVATGSAPVVTGGAGGLAEGGTVVFTAPSGTTGRYVTLMIEPTGWFMADELRVHSGSSDITGTVNYQLLTPPTDSPNGYSDNGVRLTDGSVAPIMASPAVTGWKAGVASIITVDLGSMKSVSSATAWFVSAPSWGVGLPGGVTVSTSNDARSWTPLGGTGSVARTFYDAAAFVVTGTGRSARFIRFSVAADPSAATTWRMVSEVEAAS